MQRLLIFLTAALLFVPFAASAAFATPPAGVYCSAGYTYTVSAAVAFPSVNISISGPSSPCTAMYKVMTVKGKLFTARIQSCYTMTNVSLISFTESTGTLVLSAAFSGISALLNLKTGSCTSWVPTNGTYCGKSAAGDVVVVRIGRAMNNYFYSSSLPIGIAFRSHLPSSTVPWAFTCIADVGYTGSTLFANCLGYATLTNVSNSLTLNGTYNSNTVLATLTAGSCDSAPPPGYYTGSFGSAGTALVAVTTQGTSRLTAYPIVPLSQVSSQTPGLYFVVGGNYYSSSGISPNPFNITSIQYSASKFTVSYFNKTALKATLSAGSAISVPNTTYCGTDGNRTVTMTLTQSWDNSIQTFSAAVGKNGQLLCTQVIQGVAIVGGQLLELSRTGTCATYLSSFVVAFTALSSKPGVQASITATESLTGAKWSFASLSNCTAQQPAAGDYCGNVGRNFVVMNVGGSLLGSGGQLQASVGAPYGCTLSGAQFFPQTNGNVFNSTAYGSCNFPIQVQNYASGKFTVNINGTSVVASQASCIAPSIVNGTFCGSSGSTLIELSVPPRLGSNDVVSSVGVTTLVIGSSATGLSDRLYCSINSYYATPNSLFATAQGGSTGIPVFVIDALVQSTSSWTLVGTHRSLGKFNLTLSASSCAATPKIAGVCGISGKSELVAGQSLDYYWLSSTGALNHCNLGPLIYTGGSGFLSSAQGSCAPQNVTAITIASDGNVSLTLKNGSVATKMALKSATCANSLFPTDNYCGVLGGMPVAALMGVTAKIQLGAACFYSGSLAGVSTNGSLMMTIAASSTNIASCPNLTSITYKTVGSITVTFSSGSVTLTRSCTPLPDGKYCGNVGRGIVQLTQQGSAYVFTSFWTQCSLTFTALVVSGLLVLVPQYNPCSTFAPSLTYSNGLINMTVNGTSGSLATNTCNLPSAMYCGVDVKTRLTTILLTGPQIILFTGDQNGNGALQDLNLYSQQFTSTSFSFFGSSGVQVLSNGGTNTFTIQLSTSILGPINATVSQANC